MADQQEQKVGPKFEWPKISELPKFAWNWFWRLRGLRRFKVGRAMVGERMPPIWYWLDKTWFPKNKAWFETKLKTVEDFWKYQATHLGDGKDEEGEGTLLGNPDGIVKLYENLGAYSDIDRIDIEVDWFEVGTGYVEETLEEGIPKDPTIWKRHKWNEERVKKVIADPNSLKGLRLSKKINLDSGIVFHEGKKEFEEELYCFGFANAEALAKRINAYNDQLNVIGLQYERFPADPRNRATEATRALQELVNLIAEIEKETKIELSNLKGMADPYYTKWADQVERLSPEAKKIGFIRYPHTYRIIKQFHYLIKDPITKKYPIVEEIAIRNKRVRKEDEKGDYGDILTKYSKGRNVVIKLKQEKNIYEEEEEELIDNINKLGEEINKIKKIIGEEAIKEGGKIKEEKETYRSKIKDYIFGKDKTKKPKKVEEKINEEEIKEEEKKTYISKIKGYGDRIKRYERRLEDIKHNILNKDEIVRETTPKIALNEFWQRAEEVDYGLDENGYPLEINPDTEEVLIDRWWNEIAENEWQLKTIAIKPDGKYVLKRHLGVDVRFTCPRDKEPTQDDVEIIGIPNRPKRYIKDKRFHGHVDLLELGGIIFSDWDAFRDDLRDGRYHKHSKSVADYVIEGEGGFDDNLGAPYPKAWLQIPSGIGRGKGLMGIRRRGVIPLKPTGINVNLSDKNVLINARPDWFDNVPDDEKAVTRDYKMKLPDGSFKIGKKIPTKYNPAFDRRAENLDYVYWGRMYYYRWSGNVNEWDENPFPHITTRGLALYIDHLVKSDVWNYKDAEDALEGHKFDYGIRGQGMYGDVNPAKGTGILQEN